MDSILAQLGVLDAGSVVVPIDPPAAGGDLKVDIARFAGLDRCVAERPPLDPVVGDTLEALGYETFLRDGCRILEAAKTKSDKPCSAIDAAPLRDRCVATVAMLLRNPERCPLVIAGQASLGRNPTCVAVASGRPPLCAGEEPALRATCEGLTQRSEGRCSGAPSAVHAARCRRTVARWRSALDDARADDEGRSASGATPPKGVTLPIPHATLRLQRLEGSREPPPLPGGGDGAGTDVSQDVARGVVVVEGLGGTTVELGHVRELGLSAHAPPPTARPRTAFRWTVPRTGVPRLEHFELEVPGVSTFVCAGAERIATGSRCDLTVVSVGGALPRLREDPLHLKVNGEVSSGPHRYQVAMDVLTFVRDVVKVEGLRSR